MSAPITPESIKHLARLARLELSPEEEAKLVRDLQGILAYFEELNEIKTEVAETPIEKIEHKNIFRDDEERNGTNQGKGSDAFARKENGFLKIPKVFEN